MKIVPKHRRPRVGPTERLGRLGPWHLVRLAAAGNLCRVFQARPADGPNDRPACYAVKVLLEPWQLDQAAVEMLRREALVGRKVSHPHLISILSAHVTEPPYYVVMPWLGGSTLADTIGRFRSGGSPPALPLALWLIRQVAQALAALHQHGWMHADVKPGNIIISPEGHATLLDLGFARMPAESGSLVDRCVAGTMQYVAPEMITSALRPDIRSDIYSLGVTLFELLTGRLPFAGSELAQLAEQHRQVEPPDVRALVPQLPSDVGRLVHRMLAKEPLRRPQTPAELIERLAALEIATFDQRQG
ncbi:MAG: serine/threonine-protein kinase [Pirellulales bacterium]